MRCTNTMVLPSLLVSPLGWWPDWSPTARVQRNPSNFPILLLKGVAEAAFHCAHRTSTFLSCAFCEQEGHLARPRPP